MSLTVTEHVLGRILTIDNVLNSKECKALIDEAEKAGFKPSPPSGGGHGQTVTTGARTSQFYVTEDEGLAMKLWQRVKEHVPKDLRNIKPVPYMHSVTKGDEFTPVCVSPHMRFYKYDPGQFVLKHDDYRMSRYRYDEEENQYYYQMSFLTLLIYLNDDFQDGNTAFWTKYAQVGTSGHCRFLRDGNDPDFNKSNPAADLKIQPKTGKALINDHMVQHEGEAPSKKVKYIVRTDILHEKPVPADRVNTKTKFRKKDIYSEWTRHYEPSCLHYSE
jgi:hypothetical protein